MERIRGTPPKALASKPRTWPHLEWVLEAFLDLTSSRQIGWGIGPIPVSEVTAYCDLVGMADPVSRIEFLRLIRAMDNASLAHEGRKREVERKKKEAEEARRRAQR